MKSPSFAFWCKLGSEAQLEGCRGIVHVGNSSPDAKVPVKVPDAKGRTAEGLAQEHGHHEILSFIRQLENPMTLRGGTGDAFSAAMWDERTVTRLDWSRS